MPVYLDSGTSPNPATRQIDQVAPIDSSDSPSTDLVQSIISHTDNIISSQNENRGVEHAVDQFFDSSESSPNSSSSALPMIETLQKGFIEHPVLRATQQTSLLLEDELISYFTTRLKGAFEFTIPTFEKDYGLECVAVLKTLFFLHWEGQNVPTYVSKLQNITLGRKLDSSLFDRLYLSHPMNFITKIINIILHFLKNIILTIMHQFPMLPHTITSFLPNSFITRFLSTAFVPILTQPPIPQPRLGIWSHNSHRPPTRPFLTTNGLTTNFSLPHTPHTSPLDTSTPQTPPNIQNSSLKPQFSRGLPLSTRFFMYLGSVLIPYTISYLHRFLDTYKPIEDAQNSPESTQQPAHQSSLNDRADSQPLTFRQRSHEFLHNTFIRIYGPDYSQQLTSHFKYLSLVFKIVTLVNTVLFLYNGHFLTPLDRLLNITRIINDPTQPATSILFDTLHKTMLTSFLVDFFTVSADTMLSLSNTTSSLYRYFPMLLPLGFGVRILVQYITNLERVYRERGSDNSSSSSSSRTARDGSNNMSETGEISENIFTSTLNYIQRLCGLSNPSSSLSSSFQQQPQQQLRPGQINPMTKKMTPFPPCPNCNSSPPTHPCTASLCGHIYCYYCVDMLFTKKHVCMTCFEPVLGYEQYGKQPQFESPEAVLQRKMKRDGHNVDIDNVNLDYSAVLEKDYEEFKKTGKR